MFSNSNLIISGGTFTQVNQASGPREGFKNLQRAVSPAAFHNSGERFDPPKCHPHTRVAILKKIMDWVLGEIDTDAFVLWLYGPAGAGKSAIANTIAESCEGCKVLLATFFFSRHDTNRNHARSLIPTIAYQIALSIPAARPFIEDAVESDPLVFTRSLDAQLTKLLVEPMIQLSQTGIFLQVTLPYLIVIDGLDECDINAQRPILDVLSRSVQQNRLPFRFLIASRHEQTIADAFDCGSIGAISIRLALDDSYQSRTDIYHFFQDKFKEIKNTHRLKEFIPSTWPTENDIQVLVDKSSGQFIYASTVMKYVNFPRHRPTDRLSVVLGLRPPHGNSAPFAELDALYTHIFSQISDEDVDIVMQILGTILALRTFSVITARNLAYNSTSMSLETPHAIEEILALVPGDMKLYMEPLMTVVDCEQYEQPIRILHASLGDFLLDRNRSGDFYVDLTIRHTKLARWCLNRLNEMLTRDETALEDGDFDALHLDFLAWDSFTKHCALAYPTAELHEDIRKFPLLPFIKILPKLGAPAHSPEVFITEFLGCIKGLCFEKADIEQLYLLHQAAADQYISSRLEVYDSYPRTSGLITLSLAEPKPLVHFSSIQAQLFHRSLLQIPLEDPWTYVWNYVRPQSGFKTILLDFVSDPSRSGRYALDGEKYSALSLLCLEYLCHSRVPNRIPKYIAHWAKRSKNKPWIWRKLQRNGRIYDYGKIKWMFPWDCPSSPNDLITFCLGLHYLPQLLAKAARSAALTTFATQCTLRLDCIVFPGRTKAAKSAIVAYLERVQIDVSREEGQVRCRILEDAKSWDRQMRTPEHIVERKIWRASQRKAK